MTRSIRHECTHRFAGGSRAGERPAAARPHQRLPTGGGPCTLTGARSDFGGAPQTMASPFQLISKDPSTGARRGRLSTLHGTVETPVFMPVGTQGTVKAVTPVHLREIGAEIVLGNTYHLNLRPGSGLIRDLGGLHAFMGWDGP